MLNLDTHLVLDALAGRARPAERRVLESDAWGISAIVLWEIHTLAQQGKIDVDVDDPEFNRDLGRLHVWPITVYVCRQIQLLDFRSDPADQIIAATSIARDAPLLTRDMRILGSRVVPLALQ